MTSYKYGDIFSIFINLYDNKMKFVERLEVFFANEIIEAFSLGKAKNSFEKLVFFLLLFVDECFYKVG